MRASRLTAPPIVEDSSTIQRRPGGLVEAGLVSHLELSIQPCLVRLRHSSVHTAKRVASKRSTRTLSALVHESLETEEKNSNTPK